MAQQQHLRKSAYDAVRGATEWLVEEREQARLRGNEPYGDGYTEGRKGFVNVAEGLTTLAIVESYERRHDVDLGTDGLSNDLYQADFEWLLGEIEAERFQGTPYLASDETNHFTDGVSFSSSVLLYHALDPSNFDIPGDRIQDSLSKLIEWFIDNAHESVVNDQGMGWSWCGATEMAERDEHYPPQTYFTWSASVALATLLDEGGSLDIVADYEDDILAMLEASTHSLLYDYRVDKGWVEFTEEAANAAGIGGYLPDQYSSLDPNPDVLSTCYTIWAVCYVIDVVDDIELDEDERDMLREGVDYIISRIEGRLDQVYKFSKHYKCRKDGDTYFEGAAPYTILNTLREFSKHFDFEAERVETLQDGLVNEILDKCWGGTPENRKLGFQHFADPEIESEKNVVAIYATEVGVESLLNYGIESHGPIEEEITDIFEAARQQVMDVVSTDQSGASAASVSAELDELEAMNQGFGQRYNRALEKLKQQFRDVYNNTLTQELPQNQIKKMTSSMPAQKMHGEEFLQVVLDRCYFEGEPSAFRSAISKYRAGFGDYIILPYKDALDELESLDDATIRDPVERKQRIESTVSALEDDIQKGYSLSEITDDLRASLEDNGEAD